MQWVGLTALGQPRLSEGAQPYPMQADAMSSHPYPMQLGQHAVLPLPKYPNKKGAFSAPSFFPRVPLPT